MMKFEPLPPELLAARLAPPKPGCRVVIDTDTNAEMDDPYAVIYALCSPELQVEAIYAAPYRHADGPKEGMERSYRQIQEIIRLTDASCQAFRGSDRWMTGFDGPVDSPAAKDLVERAMASDGPLYVAAIGACTNIASAILLEPKIREKIVVVWLGGHGLHMPKTDEFNMEEDYFASRTLLDSGVPLVLMPCLGVVSHMLATLPELEEKLGNRGKNGQYLLDLTREYMNRYCPGRSKVIWDIVTIGWLCRPEYFQTGLIPCPMLTPEFTYSTDLRRHPIRYTYYIDRDGVFGDMYGKI